MDNSDHEKKIGIVLFLLLFCSFAYFYQGGGANQNSRLDQIRSIVELGQLNLKPFAGSHDIVQVGSKTYPNKAPGVSLSGVIPYYLVSRLRSVIVGPFSEDFYHLLSCYLVTVTVVGIPCALGGMIFFRLLGLFYSGVGPRLICTLGLFLGTPAFAYSTVLYGHMVSSVLTLFSFYLLYKYLCLQPASPFANLFIIVAGLSGGWAVVSEYPTALIVSILSLYCLIYSLAKFGQRRFLFSLLMVLSVCLLYLSSLFFRKFNLSALIPAFINESSQDWALAVKSPLIVAKFLPSGGCLVLAMVCFFLAFHLSGRRSARFLLFLLGLILPAAILLLYNYRVFGKLFYIAYFDKRAAAHAAYRKGSLLGFSFNVANTVKAIYQTSFGPFRGFFHLSPFLVLIFPGIYYFGKVKGKKSLLVTLWILVLIYFFLNTIYPYWYGGRALGPRHAMEIIPYLGLLLFFFVVRFPRFSSLVGALSMFFMLSATAVRPEEYARQPFRELYFPAFLSGSLSLNLEATFQKNAVISQNFNAFNLGEVAGLRGQFSLFPLYLIWLIGGIFMIAFQRREKRFESGQKYFAPLPAGMKIAVVMLLAILAVQLVNLLYQIQLKAYLEELSAAGTYRVPASEVPSSQAQIMTSPGHTLQVWEILAPFSPRDTIKVKVQHAAAGEKGGFYIVAYGDKNQDDKPDAEIGKSPFLTAKKGGDWSYWTFPAAAGKMFVGNTWREDARVYFERVGWKHRQLSSQMFYSRGGPPLLSTSPRSTNMAVEVMKEE